MKLGTGMLSLLKHLNPTHHLPSIPPSTLYPLPTSGRGLEGLPFPLPCVCVHVCVCVNQIQRLAQARTGAKTCVWLDWRMRALVACLSMAACWFQAFLGSFPDSDRLAWEAGSYAAVKMPACYCEKANLNGTTFPSIPIPILLQARNLPASITCNMPCGHACLVTCLALPPSGLWGPPFSWEGEWSWRGKQ